MPSYRGNAGNLLQHWVFCEIVEACRDHAKQLAFIDATSMAPFAAERTKRKKITTSETVFDAVRNRLTTGHSTYERAWDRLLQDRPADSGYPNSAAFLTHLWKSSYSLLLCEVDPRTADELKAWSKPISLSPYCTGVEVYSGDWRDRFKKGFSVVGDFVFFSFDPNMFNRNTVATPKSENMYPADLEILVSAVQDMHQSVIVQLSTFNANDDNSQKDVSAAISAALEKCGLEIIAEVRVNGQMMSLVLTRNVEWKDSLHSLPERFESWLGEYRTSKQKARE
jgi:hypothetical protein